MKPENIVVPGKDVRALGHTGYLIYLREVFAWLSEHVSLIAPQAECTCDGAPEIDVHIPFDGLPTFKVSYEAILMEPPPMSEEVTRFEEVESNPVLGMAEARKEADRG